MLPPEWKLIMPMATLSIIGDVTYVWHRVPRTRETAKFTARIKVVTRESTSVNGNADGARRSCFKEKLIILVISIPLNSRRKLMMQPRGWPSASLLGPTSTGWSFGRRWISVRYYALGLRGCRTFHRLNFLIQHIRRECPEIRISDVLLELLLKALAAGFHERVELVWVQWSAGSRIEHPAHGRLTKADVVLRKELIQRIGF